MFKSTSEITSENPQIKPLDWCFKNKPKNKILFHSSKILKDSYIKNSNNTTDTIENTILKIENSNKHMSDYDDNDS